MNTGLVLRPRIGDPGALELVITPAPGRPLEIAGLPIVPGTLMIVPDVAGLGGGLGLTGALSVGQRAVHGTAHLLRGGRYVGVRQISDNQALLALLRRTDAIEERLRRTAA